MTDNNKKEKEAKRMFRALIEVDMRLYGRASRQRAIQVCDLILGKSCTECFYSPTSWSYNILNIFPEEKPNKFIPLPLSAFELHNPKDEVSNPWNYLMVKAARDENGNIMRYEPDSKPCAGWALVEKNQDLADHYNATLTESQFIATLEVGELIQDKDILAKVLNRVNTRMGNISPNFSRNLRVIKND
jgi:hypothetical protein